MAPTVKPMFDTPGTGGRAFGDFLGLFINLSQAAWRMAEYGHAKQSVRRLLNDAVYTLGRRPEGHYVAIVVVTRDLSVGAAKGMIKYISGTARPPMPVAAFSPYHWRQMEPPGNQQHLIVVYNVPGQCPANLPPESVNLEQARAMLSKL